MIRGLPIISPFFRGGVFGAGTPPLLDVVDRRFIKRVDDTLTDSINGRDATLLTPVSTFDRVTESSCNLSAIKEPFRRFKANFLISKKTVNNSIFSLLDESTFRFSSDNSRLTIYNKNGNDYTDFSLDIVINKAYEIEIVYDDQTKQIIVSLDGVPTTKTLPHNLVKTPAWLGYQFGDRYFNGAMWDVEVNDITIPLPHLGVGFDTQGNQIQLTTHNTGIDYIKGGSKYLLKDTPFLNDSDFMVDMKGSNDTTDLSVAIWDKSNVQYWKDNVRTGIYFNSGSPYVWHSSELKQKFIFENIQDAYSYHIWNKIINNKWKDFFIYNKALTGVNICKAKDYVKVGEEYHSIDSHTQVCKLDKMV